MVSGHAHEQCEDPRTAAPIEGKNSTQWAFPLMNIETTPLRSVRMYSAPGNIPRDSSTISNRKSWLSKPRDLLKLAQHSVLLATFRFTFIPFWEKKRSNFSPQGGTTPSKRCLISVIKSDLKMIRRLRSREFPDGPVVRPPCFHRREHGFNSWSGNWDPTSRTVRSKKKKGN